MTWRRAEVLWRTAPGFLALCTVDGRATTVTGPGDAIWEELATPRSLAELIVALSSRFACHPDEVEADLAEALRQLHESGHVVDEP